MEIKRPQRNSGLGIYAKSVEVKPKDPEVLEAATEMIEFVNEKNGKFTGAWASGFAFAHCQVANIRQPYKLFVVAPELYTDKVDKNDKASYKNYYFESQAIFNAEILELPDKVNRMVPQRKVEKDPENNFKAEVKIETREQEVDNHIVVPEACMSFYEGYWKQKNMKRYHSIKVRYQYLKKTALGLRVKTFEGWVEGLKAHIIQHETDHFDGKNIYKK